MVLKLTINPELEQRRLHPTDDLVRLAVLGESNSDDEALLVHAVDQLLKLELLQRLAKQTVGDSFQQRGLACAVVTAHYGSG
ncbi:hypothetical protein D3C76_1395660 [compost metagenome]